MKKLLILLLFSLSCKKEFLVIKEDSKITKKFYKQKQAKNFFNKTEENQKFYKKDSLIIISTIFY